MSTQVIPQALRTALWHAYAHRCFYCRKLVSYDELEIDHIVPETMASAPDVADRLAVFGLPPTWDFRAIANLAPACRPCNSLKLDRLPEPNQMVLLLTAARDKVSKVEALNSEIEEKIRRSNLGAQLSIGLETGTLTTQQVATILRQSAQGFQSLAIGAIDSAFVDASLADLRPDNVNNLFDKTVRLGPNTFTGLELRKDGNANITVQTVREYQRALRDDYYAYTTFDMKMQSYFQLAQGILEALAASRPYVHSYISDPRAGVIDLDLMPSKLLPHLHAFDEEHEGLLAKYPTLSQLLDAGELTITDCGSTFLIVKYLHFSISFREGLRSDLDGDSIEDLLLFTYMSAAPEGTMGFGIDPVALARRSPDALFEITQVVPSPINVPPP